MFCRILEMFAQSSFGPLGGCGVWPDFVKSVETAIEHEAFGGDAGSPEHLEIENGFITKGLDATHEGEGRRWANTSLRPSCWALVSAMYSPKLSWPLLGWLMRCKKPAQLVGWGSQVVACRLPAVEMMISRSCVMGRPPLGSGAAVCCAPLCTFFEVSCGFLSIYLSFRISEQVFSYLLGIGYQGEGCDIK